MRPGSRIPVLLIAILIMALASWFGSGPQFRADQGPGGGPPPSEQGRMTAPPAVKLVESPVRKDRDLRYFISSGRDLMAFDVLGYAWPEVEKWQKVACLAEGINFTEETSRQFRLRDGRHALAIYEWGHCFSLVLIYKIQAKQGKPARATLSTKDGSLEAWLMRHEGHEYAEHFLPQDQWERFLALSREQRERRPKVFPLEGTIEEVVEDQFGLVNDLKNIDLRSSKPLPLYTEFLDFQVRQAKESHNWEVKNHPERAGELREGLESTLMYSKHFRQSNCKEVATILGSVYGGWRRPPLNIISP